MGYVAYLVAAYAINILTLNVSIGFCIYVFVTKRYYDIDNPFLRGWRIYPAMALPSIWLAYVVSDAYHAFYYISQYQHSLDDSIIIDKAVREWLDTIGTIINALFLSGWEPKNKRNG